MNDPTADDRPDHESVHHGFAQHDGGDDDLAQHDRAIHDEDDAPGDARPAPDPSPRVVVGVDGGGSKTRAVVAALDGTILGSADAPGSAARADSIPHSADVIAAGVREALRHAGMDGVRPLALAVGVAGVGREPERAAVERALLERDLAGTVEVTTDAMISLDDAFADGPGILLIAGTGSIAFGRGPEGRFERCGGWGPVLGDEGGGAWLGRRACNVVAAASDGREPDTALVPAVLTAIEADHPADLIPWAARATPADFAALAPVVLRVAADGDLRANSVLALGVEELVLHVRTLARTLFVDERAAVPLAFAGGLLTRGAPLRKRLEHRLKTAVPGAQLHQTDVKPERGAVRRALALVGVEAGS